MKKEYIIIKILTIGFLILNFSSCIINFTPNYYSSDFEQAMQGKIWYNDASHDNFIYNDNKTYLRDSFFIPRFSNDILIQHFDFGANPGMDAANISPIEIYYSYEIKDFNRHLQQLKVSLTPSKVYIKQSTETIPLDKNSDAYKKLMKLNKTLIFDFSRTNVIGVIGFFDNSEFEKYYK